MLGVLVWIVVILLICFSVFGGPCLLPLYVLFVVVVGFYFGVKYLDILKSATTRLYDTEAKIICIVSKKGAQCIECHHKDI